jgi:hypothetical protein
LKDSLCCVSFYHRIPSLSSHSLILLPLISLTFFFIFFTHSPSPHLTSSPPSIVLKYFPFLITHLHRYTHTAAYFTALLTVRTNGVADNLIMDFTHSTINLTTTHPQPPTSPKSTSFTDQIGDEWIGRRRSKTENDSRSNQHSTISSNPTGTRSPPMQNLMGVSQKDWETSLTGISLSLNGSDSSVNGISARIRSIGCDASLGHPIIKCGENLTMNMVDATLLIGQDWQLNYQFCNEFVNHVPEVCDMISVL